MATTTVDEITAKTAVIDIEPKTGAPLKAETMKEKAEGTESKTDVGETAKDENVAVEIEPKTGTSFPVRLDSGLELNAVGLRKKNILGIGLKIYGFGMYADNEKLKDLLREKIGKAPAKPTKEMYQAVIDSDVGMMVRLVIVFFGLTIGMVRKNFDEGLGASIKKITGGQKNEELLKKVMGGASDDIKLTTGSVIEITRFPGYILQTKVKDEVVSKVESELLCRAYFQMYLGDDTFDKDAREKFGISLLSLF
ncbi:hypothetical protein HHK36_015652 [Tetracentron sinense]|uniref:Chalcone isomerase domain-containing protein n=1 Tax=Tetracentron sinense TaxID=13715 RepID=A0A835DGF2_TETSI|nr:hypothetical protein HHK36_015652 [Tetracentron sinense]